MLKLNNIIRFITLFVFCCFITTGTFAADNNNCYDVETYPYINPMLTLCSTHAYNMGWENNKHSNAEIDEMKKVIGLKSTVITQQMKRQYDNLEGVLRKLKTQLQKSVLKANLEAAGGKSEDKDGGKSNDKSIVLAGAENCGSAMDVQSAFNCAKKNISIVLNNVDSNKSKACKQLQKTYTGVSAWLRNCNKIKKSDDINCNDSKDGIKQKAQELNVCIIEEERQRMLEERAAGSGGTWK